MLKRTEKTAGKGKDNCSLNQCKLKLTSLDIVNMNYEKKA